MNPNHKYRITAIRLAEKALEECLIEKAFHDTIFRCDISGHIYVVKRRLTMKDQKMTIDIKINFDNSDEVIYTLSTKRYR